MKAYLDYAPMDVDGDRISDVTDSMPTQEMPFVLERKTTKSMLIKNRYEVVTDKGNFIIETTNNKFHDFFKENIEHFKDLKVQWADRNTVNFGYVPTRMEPTRKQYDYDKYSVLLGLSGYDKEMGVLTLSKMGHISRNGIEKSVFGKVTKGRHILDLLGTNDKIKDIREVEVRSEQYEYEVVTDDATIKENDNIITKTVIDVFEQCPFAVEHLLFLIRDGVLAIDKKNITYCRNDKLQGVSLPQESSLERKRGSISVRNAGKGKGSVFIYFRDAIEDKSHSVAGNIINGLELPMNLKPGQRFKIESKTERLNTLGLEQIEAEKITKRIGIGHERIGDTDDNAIIIEQDPEITM
ncbi:MAG TPA: methanogenesis marker 3 protein, partial [Candidatus Methanofastidiosa archaeon]|nr:methanogenesis marker 3 protein [Candidatus Methanofastidiosa archaeon]